MAINLAPRNTQARPEPENETQLARRPAHNQDNPSPAEPRPIAVAPLSSAEIMAGDAPREFILLCGKDGVGKTCAIVSLAWYVENIQGSGATFFFLDTENKARNALRSFGADAPTNIVYYKVDDMNQITWAVDQILRQHKPGDWLAVESMSRVWERAQDLGYMAVSGYLKAEYMEERARMAGKKAPVTPTPDQLWSVTKGAHDGAFLDRLTACEDLNVILSTTLSRPPKSDAFMKENVERKELRLEVGIDSGIEGAPRLPYFAECLLMLSLKNGVVSCRVLRDNASKLEDSRVEFIVDSKKTFGVDFFGNCR